MGTNRRYPSIQDHDVDRMIERWKTETPEPVSLSDQELDKANQLPHRCTPAIPVTVWIHFTDGTVVKIPNARAVAYTSKAVFVEGEYHAQKFGAWVWANAVERITPKQSESF
jgi:hypothetical protein